MARLIEKQLSEALRETGLQFLGNNPIFLNDIYHLITIQFPNLCDDDYFCPHKKKPSREPEWHHVVRNVIESLKRKGVAKHTNNRSEWIFNFQVGI